MADIGRIKESTRVVERALVDSASNTIWQMATAKMPFLAWPVVKAVGKWILDQTLYWLSNEGIIWFNTVWIRVNVNADAARLEEARQRAIVLLDSTNIPDDGMIDDVNKELHDAFRDLYRGNRGPL